MSDTPRTDAAAMRTPGRPVNLVDTEFARVLERENQSLRCEVERWEKTAGFNARAHNNVEDERHALYVAMRNLYDAGIWVLPVDDVPVPIQVALWDAARKAIGRS